jgi:inhibitor of KinA
MSKAQHPVLKPVGEDALLVEFEPEICPEVNHRVRQLTFAIEQAALPAVEEVVPAYRSLMVYFNADKMKLLDLQTAIEACEQRSEIAQLPAPRLFRIPTVYGGEFGPDMRWVAETTNCTPDEVVELFSSQQYPVYCLGFLCSLPYLGGIPERLHVPRRTSPRTNVPAGSVGIAGGQAVVLPIEMPSGFHYLGRTFIELYDPARMPPTAIRPGDLVEFPAVSADEVKQAAGHWLGDYIVGSSQNH